MSNYPALLPLNKIVPGNNPRKHFDEKFHEELVESIKSQGVCQSLLLRPHPLIEGKFEIVAGERRWRAAIAAHNDEYEVPVLIREMSDAEAANAALTENVIRADMNPAEEAEAAARLLAENANDRDETARRLGWSRSMLDRRLALMNAADDVRQALVSNKITLGHAEILAAAEKKKQSGILVNLLASPQMPSVSQLKEMLSTVARSLDSACFDKTDCATCPQNSNLQASMFTESIAAGNCTGPDCFKAKTEAKLEEIRLSLVDSWPRVEILRPGTNFTTIKLQVEGPSGVGAEQAQACQQCKNFGAGIGGVPGKEGRVFESFCFDTPCNTRMVAKNLKAQNPQEAPATSETKPATDKAASKTTKAATSKAVTTSASITNAVNEFRKKVWRKALQAEIAQTSERSLSMLVALALNNKASKINSAFVKDCTTQSLTNAGIAIEGLTSFETVLQTIGSAKRETLAEIVLRLAPAAALDMEIHDVQVALRNYQVDLTKHFVVNAEYLDLLTKVEIQAVATEIGLDKAHDEKKFKSLFSEKKDELIKKLLDVQNFSFAVVPKAIHYDTPEKA